MKTLTFLVFSILCSGQGIIVPILSGKFTAAAPPISRVQIKMSTGDSGSSTTISITPDSSTTTGNVVVVSVQSENVTAAITVSDGVNSFLQKVASSGAEGFRTFTFCSVLSSGTTNAITATFDSGSTFRWIAMDEYSGLTCTEDVVSASDFGTSASADSGPITTVTAKDLLYGVIGSFSSSTVYSAPGSGWTIQQQANGADSMMTEDQIASNTGTFNAIATLTPANSWSAIIIAFKGQ